MSLFKAREWWSTVVGEEEEFDSGCMCVANIDNNVSGTGEYGRRKDRQFQEHLQSAFAKFRPYARNSKANFFL